MRKPLQLGKLQRLLQQQQTPSPAPPFHPRQKIHEPYTPPALNPQTLQSSISRVTPSKAAKTPGDKGSSLQCQVCCIRKCEIQTAALKLGLSKAEMDGHCFTQGASSTREHGKPCPKIMVIPHNTSECFDPFTQPSIPASILPDIDMVPLLIYIYIYNKPNIFIYIINLIPLTLINLC